MLTLLPKGVQKKSQKFLIEDFFQLRISPRIFEKIRNSPNGIMGETDSKKNQKQKNPWDCPFKPRLLAKNLDLQYC